VPKLPDSVSSRLSSAKDVAKDVSSKAKAKASSVRNGEGPAGEAVAAGSSKVSSSLGPAIAKIRGVDPKAAKGSAQRGVAGAKDVVKLSIDYLKQETKGPLDGVGRFVAFGTAGALLLGFGLVMLGLAVLRGLQTALAYERVDTDAIRLGDGAANAMERGPLSGSLSWVPYLLTALSCAVAIGLIVFGWTRATRSARRA
jgi:hypothetical protein